MPLDIDHGTAQECSANPADAFHEGIGMPHIDLYSMQMVQLSQTLIQKRQPDSPVIKIGTVQLGRLSKLWAHLVWTWPDWPSPGNRRVYSQTAPASHNTCIHHRNHLNCSSDWME